MSFWSYFCLLSLIINTIHSRDYYDTDNIIVGNLRRREVIPLAQLYHPYGFKSRRRYNMNANEVELSYRRSTDIRDEINRRFELTESQIREANIAENKENLDKLHNELRWLTIDTDEGIGLSL